MSDTDQRRDLIQHDRSCEILNVRIGMKVYFEQKKTPHQITFEVFGAEGTVRITTSVPQ